ncbi:hypothetical protein, partial [Pseudomonas sp.]|uniref:hypothetical protein n=1 Tax=Pseudomonas sp. TaxID=306 RepID=UPI0032DB985F
VSQIHQLAAHSTTLHHSGSDSVFIHSNVCKWAEAEWLDLVGNGQAAFRRELSESGHSLVAEVLSFERLEYRFFCDIRDR